MSTRVSESVVIDAPLDRVWGQVCTMELGKAQGTISSVEYLDKANHTTVGGFRTITYADKTVQTIHLLEYSESHHYLTWEITASKPETEYASAIHTVALSKVTSTNETFVEFYTDFSREASQKVHTDSKWKKTDYFKTLAAVTESRAGQFVRSLDFSKLNMTNEKELKAAWDSIDTDKNGTLDKGEIEKMIQSLAKRIQDEQDTVHQIMARMFQLADQDVSSSSSSSSSSTSTEKKEEKKSTKKVTHKHVLTEFEKKCKGMMSSFVGTLDKNKDGKIDWSEFKFFFPKWFQHQISDLVYGSF